MIIIDEPDIDEVQYICVECVVDPRLKMFIEKINSSIDTCSCCGEKGTVSDTNSNEFAQILKALIRYHFSEWDYNSHFGGDDFHILLANDNNLFFNKKRFLNIDRYNSIVETIEFAKAYEEYDEGVSLYAGHYDGQQNPLLISIKKKLDWVILKLGERLKTENYFILEKEMTSILTKYIPKSSIQIKAGDSFYRGRIGFKEKKDEMSFTFEDNIILIPFTGAEIGAPPPYLSQVGRINRHGVSFFYCATNQYTAISEIRPHPGDIVSIGKFNLRKDVKIFDLSDKQFINYYHSDKSLDEYRSLNTLCELMNKVVPPSEKQHYSITQLIADCIRQLEFDGIIFNSSISTGYNLVLFDPQNVIYNPVEASTIEVEAVNYKYKLSEWIENKSNPI